MLKPLAAAILLSLAATAAQAAPQRGDALADLRRQQAGLQDSIARLELNALIARIDRANPAPPARPVRADKPDRELAAYAY